MTRVTVTEFVRGFADFINRVAYQGEHLVLVRGRRELADVVPRRAGVTLSELPRLLNALPRLDEQDASAFADDLEAARASLGAAPDGTTWES
jgi:hypothetical protein